MSGGPARARIRVLIVDDSPIVRMAFRALLEGEPDLEVVGDAGDPYQARELILSARPDVITLDVEMPHMDGITFLRRLMQHQPTPVVVISSVAGRGSSMAVDALYLGAAEVVDKPATALARQRFGPTLRAALRAAAQSRPRAAAAAGPPAALSGPPAAALIAIGASTGGPAVLLDLLPRLPRDLPPVLIVQHMPEGFTGPFAARLAQSSGHDVREATSGEPLRAGMFRVAPGGRHLVLAGSAQQLRAAVQDGPLINFHRPNIDLFFQSASRLLGPAAVGVLLTGMGDDGARGLLAMRQAGAATLGQDEASSVVYGMPKIAYEIGAVAAQVGAAGLAEAITHAVKLRPGAPRPPAPRPGGEGR